MLDVNGKRDYIWIFWMIEWVLCCLLGSNFLNFKFVNLLTYNELGHIHVLRDLWIEKMEGVPFFIKM